MKFLHFLSNIVFLFIPVFLAQKTEKQLIKKINYGKIIPYSEEELRKKGEIFANTGSTGLLLFLVTFCCSVHLQETNMFFNNLEYWKYFGLVSILSLAYIIWLKTFEEAD